MRSEPSHSVVQSLIIENMQGRESNKSNKAPEVLVSNAENHQDNTGARHTDYHTDKHYHYDQFSERDDLVREFFDLSETLNCRICREREKCFAFLPCGHLVCCADCAPAMKRCPICDGPVTGTIKAMFGTAQEIQIYKGSLL
uniref:Inhibitor of apoptosis n=1 Tax=Crassostrea virginica TaxID=6565 RepID=A0A8B8AFL8_CRAVI|nr:putative inhibitor of apoptosis [Crassostrea virginica]